MHYIKKSIKKKFYREEVVINVTYRNTAFLKPKEVGIIVILILKSSFKKATYLKIP
jgi:hypothetical protein